MKKVLSILIAFVMLVGIAGCAQSNTPSSASPSQSASASQQPQSQKEAKPLRVAVQSFYASHPVGLIVDRGWDKEAGIPFELSVFNGGAPINEAMAAGLWDVAVTGGAFIYALANYDGKLIAHQINGMGGNSMVARVGDPVFDVKGHNPDFPDVYGSPETVKGRVVLHNTGTTAQYITEGWLKRLGMSNEEINAVHMEFMQIVQSFKAGEGDFASITVPSEFDNFEANGWKEVASLTTLDMPLYEATVCTKEAYETRYDDIVDFVELLYRANDEMIADPALHEQVAIKWYKDNGKDLEDSVVKLECKNRPLIGSKEAKQIDLENFAVEYGNFQIGIDKIEAEKAELIKNNIAKDVFEEALSRFN